MRDDDAELKKRRDALAATAPSDQKSSEELLRKRVEELTQENARLKQPSPTTTNESGDLALKYDALRREYKLYSANALKALQEQKALAADAAKGLQLADLGRRKPAGNVRENDQMAYLKNLMAQYLVCAEEAPKQHMERAVMTVLGFTDSSGGARREEATGERVRRSSALAAWFSQTPAPTVRISQLHDHNAARVIPVTRHAVDASRRLDGVEASHSPTGTPSRRAHAGRRRRRHAPSPPRQPQWFPAEPGDWSAVQGQSVPTSYASFGPASSAPAAKARSSRSDALPPEMSWATAKPSLSARWRR